MNAQTYTDIGMGLTKTNTIWKSLKEISRSSQRCVNLANSQIFANLYLKFANFIWKNVFIDVYQMFFVFFIRNVITKVQISLQMCEFLLVSF